MELENYLFCSFEKYIVNLIILLYEMESYSFLDFRSKHLDLSIILMRYYDLF